MNKPMSRIELIGSVVWLAATFAPIAATLYFAIW